MSDCPDCENVGWTWEVFETLDDELSGEWYRRECRNWRHKLNRPTLDDIARIARQMRKES